MLAGTVLARSVAVMEATTAKGVEGQTAVVAVEVMVTAAAAAKVANRVVEEGGEVEMVAGLETAPQVEMEREAEEVTLVGVKAETSKAGWSTRTPRCRGSPHRCSSSRTARAHAPCTPPQPVQRSSE